MSEQTYAFPLYCDHCGRNLIGEYDHIKSYTYLRCPQTLEVKVRIADRDQANWPKTEQRWLQQLITKCFLG